MKKIAIYIVLILMLSSCRSRKWSCKKRYVNAKYEYSETYKKSYINKINSVKSWH